MIAKSSEEGVSFVHYIKKETRSPYRGRFFRQSQRSLDTSALSGRYESAERLIYVVIQDLSHDGDLSTKTLIIGRIMYPFLYQNLANVLQILIYN